MSYQWNWSVFGQETVVGDGATYANWMIAGLKMTVGVSLSAWALALSTVSASEPKVTAETLADLGRSVVIKIVSPGIPHKQKLGGVKRIPGGATLQLTLDYKANPAEAQKFKASHPNQLDGPNDRNLIVFDRFVLVSANSGMNLYEGNNPVATGEFAFRVSCPATP